jgi:hypothetical protein
MTIAYELGIDEEEVLKWTPQKYERWGAFLKVRGDAVKKAARR